MVALLRNRQRKPIPTNQDDAEELSPYKNFRKKSRGWKFFCRRALESSEATSGDLVVDLSVTDKGEQESISHGNASFTDDSLPSIHQDSKAGGNDRDLIGEAYSPISLVAEKSFPSERSTESSSSSSSSSSSNERSSDAVLSECTATTSRSRSHRKRKPTWKRIDFTGTVTTDLEAILIENSKLQKENDTLRHQRDRLESAYKSETKKLVGAIHKMSQKIITDRNQRQLGEDDVAARQTALGLKVEAMQSYIQELEEKNKKLESKILACEESMEAFQEQDGLKNAQVDILQEMVRKHSQKTTGFK